MKSKLVIIVFMALIVSCSQTKTTSLNNRQIREWFEKSYWKTLSIQLADCIDKQQFIEQNEKNPTAWRAAFDFLSRKDLNSLPVGRIDLQEGGTYATVTDYVTKDDADFEAHRKYIDIQYVVSGSEYIYITSLDSIHKYSKEYDIKNDIEFFQKAESIRFLATPKSLVVLFPDNGHKPCIKVTDNQPVRKIVVKVPVENE